MSSSPAVELIGISKRYGDLKANADVSLAVEPGTIHAVVGENGAGKSTAMKILYGMVRPDRGEIRVLGQARRWNSPADAIACGIGMVHQHFMLAGPHTVLDNILVGAEPRLRLGSIDRAGARAEIQALSQRYSMPLRLDQPVESLSVGEQQRVEILKLLYRKAVILILDEPTAVLTPQEVDRFFENLKVLTREGKTALIITHKLREVMRWADQVTVLRAGRAVGTWRTAETTAEALAQAMVGRPVTLYGRRAASPSMPKAGPVILKVRRPGVSFDVHAGEVVGIAGVEGNGQTELLRALTSLGPERQAAGARDSEIELNGVPIGHLPTRERLRLGMSVIPADRQREGLLMNRPARESFLLGLQRIPEFRRSFGRIGVSALNAAVMRTMREFDVRPCDPAWPSGGLSGGNQQKLIVGRELYRKPCLLIAAQPTRGVDIGAIEFLHERILAEKNAGMAVLLVSSELDEIRALSDRILVMYAGRVAAEFGADAEEGAIGLAMAGAGA